MDKAALDAAIVKAAEAYTDRGGADSALTKTVWAKREAEKPKARHFFASGCGVYMDANDMVCDTRIAKSPHDTAQMIAAALNERERPRWTANVNTAAAMDNGRRLERLRLRDAIMDLPYWYPPFTDPLALFRSSVLSLFDEVS